MAQTGFATVSSQAEIDRIREQSDSVIVMQEGQQSDLQHRYYFETLISGEKGTGKTTASIVWLVRGNLDVPDKLKDQTDILYVNNPVFRAAVVRKNSDDLNSWIEDAKRVYGTKGDLLGATYTTQPREFTWKSGAKITLTHMADSESYQRLTGQSLTRLFWDEITFEPSMEVYEKVFSSIRSPHKKMRAQILLACNPEGPGLPWVKERFIKQYDENGKMYKAGEVIKIPLINPLTKERTYIERVYYHWKMSGNPAFIEKDPTYQARLATISNPSLRAAYLEGDWDAAGGKFFEFRRQPRNGEPPNACHIFDAGKVVIQPWWPRLIGLDWGFSHYFAALKVAMSPDGRVWVIDELVQKGLGSLELGAVLARWCVPDMTGLKACGAAPVIPVFISPDAIEQRRDSFGTTAENIRDGIMEIFGAGSSEILSKEDTDNTDFDARLLIRTESKMPLRRSSNRRHHGWDRIRNLMSWESVAAPDLSQYDHQYAMDLAAKDAHEFFKYRQEFDGKQEALPRLQISSRLRYLPDAIESAVSSPNDLEDIASPKRGNKDIVQLHDDVRDAFRYAAEATNLFQQIKTPLANRIDAELDRYPGMTEEQKFQARPFIADRLGKKTVRGFRIGRGANAGVYIT
ncbi:MAG: hypothetical protein EBR82_07300 [Caulobacteraceae bacterium]|nr:hypothetical protein [Caulobacteraceae bacterium]